MDLTPERKIRTKSVEPSVVEGQKENQTQYSKLKKPPPITPRRFTRFFTPRPRNATATVKTSRAALKVLTGSNINIRNVQSNQSSQSDAALNPGTPRGKKRKLSFVTNDSTQSSPVTRVSFLHGSQEIRSSPTIPERQSPSRQMYQDVDMYDEEEVETDIEMDDEDDDQSAVPAPRIVPYRAKSMSGGIMSTRLSGRRTNKEALSTDLWQQQTAHFYSSPADINSGFGRQPQALPFAVAACNTNPIIAIGDEDGTVRIMDSSAGNPDGLTKTFFSMRPHDNAIMDLEFSPDDTYLATACGDQSCQIIDMQTQTSLYTLKGHRCSVKRIAFQPGSANNILATCGRDGQLNFWDLRCDSSKTPINRWKPAPTTNPMTSGAISLQPQHFIRDAHTAGPRSAKAGNTKAKPNLIPGREDFSITSLSFLGAARPHLVVTASEIDTTVKVWDIRYHHSNNRRTPVPLSCTDEPVSHAFHRRFGVTSLVLNTDGSKLYALSRDHTVYAYSTAHLVMGSAPQISLNSNPSKGFDGGHQGLGPLYGFRHPLLRVQTFWPRLAIRKQTDSTPELLAVGSTEDCAVLFPTDERFLTKSTMNISSHNLGKASFTTSFSSQTPTLTRSTSASSASGLFRENKEGISIYRHGTGLIRGHDKEVTSLAWTSEGSLVTASDDYTVRCWREDSENARRMRSPGEKNGEKWKCGWSAVEMEGFDDEY